MPPRSIERKVLPQQMYTLRGSDEKEHGPLSARDVRDWIAAGRATAGTQALAAGEAKWRPLSEFVEFESALKIAELAAPSEEETRPRTYRLLAITSLVLSVVGVCFLPGIILGIVALILNKIRPKQFGGRRLAVAAILIGLAWPITVGSVGYSMMHKAQREYYKGQSCPTHIHSLASSLRVVAYANNGTYPSADSWCDAVSKEVTSKTHYQCPEDPKHATCSYAFNAKLSGAKNPNPSTVAIFEADLGWNGSGGPADMIKTPRHHFGGIPIVQPKQGYFLVGLANGSWRFVPTNQVQTLRWDP